MYGGKVNGLMIKASFSSQKESKRSCIKLSGSIVLKIGVQSFMRCPCPATALLSLPLK